MLKSVSEWEMSIAAQLQALVLTRLNKLIKLLVCRMILMRNEFAYKRIERVTEISVSITVRTVQLRQHEVR